MRARTLLYIHQQLAKEAPSREMHARGLFTLRYPSASDPGCDARPEALAVPAEEEDAEEE